MKSVTEHTMLQIVKAKKTRKYIYSW